MWWHDHAAQAAGAGPDPLPPPFDTPPDPAGLRPTASTMALVRSQVDALLQSAPAFHQLADDERGRIQRGMVSIAGYAAECLRDGWAQSARLAQRPVARRREELAGPAAAALASSDDFRPASADQVARVTRDTLEAISFPEFVADLIQGSFRAIVSASIQQMEAYGRLLEDVSKTVEEFESDSITDNQARDWLVQRYPSHLQLAQGEPRLIPCETASDLPPPRWREDLGLSDDVDPTDETAIEETLVPAARRQLAQSRLQTLSTLVLMGINRVVVTGGRLRATMAFYIDTSDRAAQQKATDFDIGTAAAGSVGFGPWSASASMSVGYVSSTRKQSATELTTSTDLTSEVEIHFRGDVFELNRFLEPEGALRISANTAVPAANEPPWATPMEARVTPVARLPLEPVRPVGETPPRLPPPATPDPVRTPPPAGTGSGA